VKKVKVDNEENFSNEKGGKKKIKRTYSDIAPSRQLKNLTVIPLPSSSIYESIIDKSKLLKNPEYSFTDLSIPYYVDCSGFIEGFKHFILEESNNDLVLIMDNPGFGKTLTPLAISEYFESIYIKITIKGILWTHIYQGLGLEIFQIIPKKIDKLNEFENKPNEIENEIKIENNIFTTEEQLISDMTICWSVWWYLLLKNFKDLLNETKDPKICRKNVINSP